MINIHRWTHLYPREHQGEKEIAYKCSSSENYATFTSLCEAQIDSGHGTGAELSMMNIMNTLQLLKERELRAQRQLGARSRIAPMNRPSAYHTSAHQSPARLNRLRQVAKTLAYRGISYESMRSNWL